MSKTPLAWLTCSFPNDERLLIGSLTVCGVAKCSGLRELGIAGYPGSGKSTIAYPLTERINELLQEVKGEDWDGEGSDKTSDSGKTAEEHALCVGMDGWHYSQAYLASHEVCPLLEDLFDLTVYRTLR